MRNFLVFKRLTLIVLCSFVLLAVACKKEDAGPALESKQYVLYNYSSGSAVQSGSFTINELADGNASVAINLSAGYLVPGITMPAYITTMGENNNGPELTVAILQPVDGTTGKSTTALIKASDNTAIKYTDLISKKGYSVKVLNNTNVQAKGNIE